MLATSRFRSLPVRVSGKAAEANFRLRRPARPCILWPSTVHWVNVNDGLRRHWGREMGLLGLYFQPSGRISRSWFWLGFIGLIAIEIGFSIWMGMTMFGHDYLDPAGPPLAKPAFQLGLIIDLIFLFPTFVILAKRFHDRNKGAVWAVPFLVAHVAAVGAAIVGILPIELPKDPVPVSPAAIGVSLLWLLALIWILVELGCIRGTDGANRYGPDPLAR